MLGKHSANFSISAGGRGGGGESPTKYSEKEGRLDMITIFRWGFLRKMGVRFFRGGAFFTYE